MIHFACPSCGKKLHAKPSLAGRTAKCPNCTKPFQIPAASDLPETFPLDDAEPGEHVIAASEEHLTVAEAPERLNRESHYLICDRARLLAMWQNDGAGWLIRVGTGFQPAKRNRDKLPNQGSFQLTELKFNMSPEGKRLTGIASYQLASHWALTVLDQGDDTILEKVSGPGCLNRDQKNAVRQALKDQFMRPVWQDATAIVDYLGNMDFHSPGVDMEKQDVIPDVEG
jgi:hypothetical protein